MRGLLRLFLFVALTGTLLSLGCASSRSTKTDDITRAAVVGSWKYRVTGYAPLDQGVLHISLKKGRLRGLFRDHRRGRFRAEVDIHESRMEITVGRLLIAGRIENDRFSGYIRSQRWDASVASYRRQRQIGSPSASFYAERIREGALADVVPPLECQSILREANGCL